MTLSRRTLARAAATLTAAAALGTALPAFAADPRVKFVTSEGDFVVELYPDKAPKTVANFLQYVKDKHYDGTVFHRVIKGFMVQGGGFDRNYKEKETRASVIHEGRKSLAAGLRNVTGTIAMARTNDPTTGNGGQFFFVDARTTLPDPAGYSVFGQVVSGLDIVDRIVAEGLAGGASTTDGVPAAPISILRVAVTEKKA